MKNEVLANRMNFFKETAEGQRELSGIELVIDARGRAEGRIEGRAEGRAEGIFEGEVKGKTEMATKLIQLGQMSLEMIAEVSGLPVEELRKIQASAFNPA